MRFVSTENRNLSYDLRDAVTRCLAEDKGMLMPEFLPVLPKAFFNNIGDMSLREIAYVVATSLFGGDIPAPVLKNIVDESFAFDAPLVKKGDNTYFLELFHGPTLTFKDYGARFMSRLLKHYAKLSPGQCRHVLVATTGNTGAAAACGMLGIPGVEVSVLYPHASLSRSQIAQFTSLGDNIHPVEVAGSVEDCKRLLRTAIGDASMADLKLTGANSINVARLLPQVTFAMHAYARLKEMEVPGAENAVYAMPCGNLSNLVATVMARKMGLPTGKIVAATNVNHRLRDLLEGKQVDASQKPVRTLTPSIDMIYPSGWARLPRLYNNDLKALRNDVDAICIHDEITAQTVNRLRADHAYTVDPHTAAAAAAVDGYEGAPRIVFATGHPAKQLDIMTRITGAAIDLPVQLNRFMAQRRHPAIIPPTVPALRKHLMSL